MLKLNERKTIQNLTDELGFVSYRTTLNWLTRREIPYKKDGRDYYVLQWHIDFSFALERAEDLKRRFPIKWITILKASISDESIVNAVLEVVSVGEEQKFNKVGSIKRFIK